MTRFGLLILSATLGTALLACGSSNSNTGSTKSAVDLVPGNNAVSGWSIDQANPEPITAHNWMGASDSVYGYIDGHADFWSQGPATLKLWAWQHYKNSSLPALTGDTATIELHVIQVASADQASKFYDFLLSRQGTDYTSPSNWQATQPTLGTQSRIEDTSTQWWINFYQDEFYVEFQMNPSYGSDFVPSNPDLKAEAIRFAQAIASNPKI